jgi:hypothetical protein
VNCLSEASPRGLNDLRLERWKNAYTTASNSRGVRYPTLALRNDDSYSPRRPTVRRILGLGWRRTANTKLQPENYWRITKSLHWLYRECAEAFDVVADSDADRSWMFHPLAGNLWRVLKEPAPRRAGIWRPSLTRRQTKPSGTFIAHQVGERQGTSRSRQAKSTGQTEIRDLSSGWRSPHPAAIHVTLWLLPAACSKCAGLG